MLPPVLVQPRRFAAWRDLDPRIGRLAFARAVNTLGLSLVMSFLGIYVIDDRGYSAKLYGALALIANLGQSLANAWAGELSDRIGRRPIIVGSLVARAAIIAVLGAQILADAPLAWIAVTFVASSSLRGCFEPVAYALCSDLARPEQRTAAFGLQRMGTNLGWAMGPALGGLLATVVPYGAVFFLASLGMIGAAVLCFRIEPTAAPAAAALEPVPMRAVLREAVTHSGEGRRGPPPRRGQVPAEPPLHDGPIVATALPSSPPMRVLLAATVLFALAHTQMFTLFTVYLSDELELSKASIGLIYAVNGSLVLLLQWPALGVIHRFGIVRILPLAALVFALGFVLIGLAVGLISAMIAIAVITSAEVLFAPAHQTAAAHSGDAARLGKSFGRVSWAQTIGIAFAPLLGGTLFDAIRDRHLLLWSIIAGLCVALAALLVRYGRLVQRRALVVTVGR